MKKLLLISIAVLSGISVMAQNSASLKLNLEKNKVYRLKSVSEQTITQTVSGNQQTTESRTDYTLSLKMIDMTPDFLIAEVRFDTLNTRTNTMGKVLSINSTSEGNIKSSETAEIMSYVMNRLCKNPLYAKIDYTGKPVEIVNQKMLSEILLKDTSFITLTGPTADAIKKQIVNTVSDENLKTMVGSFTWCLPGKEVSTGDDWIITQQLNSGGMLLDMKTANHLDRINDNKAFVTVETNIKAAANATPIQSGGATVTYDNLQGFNKSTRVIDIQTGLTLEDNAVTRISGTLGISAPGFSMDMPMEIRGESRVRALQ